MTAAVLALVNALHSAYEIREDRAARPHGHPVAGCERHIVTNAVAVLAANDRPVRLVGIGERNGRYANRYQHVLAPVLTAADVVSGYQHPNMCRHTLEQCNHIALGDVLVLHHVVYYVSPAALAKALLVTRRPAYITCHRFPKFSGDLCNMELHYTHTGPDTVHMTAIGGETFSHSAIHWLTNSGHIDISTDEGPRSLCWNLKYSVGDTDIFKVALHDDVLPQPHLPATWRTYDTTGLTGNAITTITVDTEATFVGNMLWLARPNTTTTAVPRGLISYLTVQVLGHPRDPKTLRMLQGRARKWMLDNTDAMQGFPEQLWASAITAAVTTAMTLNLDNEVDGLLNLNSNRTALTNFNQLSSTFNTAEPQLSWAEWLMRLPQHGAALVMDLDARTGFILTLILSALLSIVLIYIDDDINLPLLSTSTALAPFTARPSMLGVLPIILDCVVFAPLLEEGVKRLHPAAQHLLIWSEAYVYIAAGFPLDARLQAAVMHYVFAALPYKYGVAVHSLWNAFALASIAADDPIVLGAAERYATTTIAQHCAYLLFAACIIYAASKATPRNPPWRVITIATLVALLATLHAQGEHRSFVVSLAAGPILWLITIAAAWAAYALFTSAPAVTIIGHTTRLRPGPVRDDAVVEPSDELFASKDNHQPTHHLVGPQLLPTPSILASNATNEYVGVTRRVAPRDLPTLQGDAFNLFADWCYEAYPVLFSDKATRPMPFARWLARFGQATRTALIAAKQAWDDGADYTREALNIKFFVKQELGFKQPDITGTTETKPRIISSASAYYNVIVGPYVAALQQHIKAVHHASILIGESSRERIGTWFKRHLLWRGMECDFSTFDATQDAQLRCLIINLWDTFHGMPEAVRTLMLKRAERKTGYGTHGTKIRLNGTMASGDPDTYLGNTVLNILVQTYAYCTATGQDVHEALRNFTIIAAGDDSLSFDRLRTASCNVMERTILSLGMVAKFIQHNDPAAELVSYCSSYFIPVGRTWFLSPKPGRIIAKLPWVAGPPGRTSTAQLRANALGVWASVQYTPFAREYVARVLELTASAAGTDLPTERHTFTSNPVTFWLRLPPLDPDTACWMHMHYHVSDAEYLAWVRLCSRLRLNTVQAPYLLSTLHTTDLDLDY